MFHRERIAPRPRRPVRGTLADAPRLDHLKSFEVEIEITQKAQLELDITTQYGIRLGIHKRNTFNIWCASHFAMGPLQPMGSNE